MKLFSLQITPLVLGWLIGLGILPLTAHADPPTPMASALEVVQLRVLLRTPDGQPVPSIAVDLMPAAPELGGPPADTPAQSGQTDAMGAVIFDGLQGAIWRVTFTGRYAGQPLQPTADQGQPPYGTTRGNGFVVQTSLQEENDAPAPVVGVAAPLVETLSFVLLSSAGDWIPAIDLAPPTAPPQPLNLLAQAPTQTTFYVPAPQRPTNDPLLPEPLLEDGRKTASDGSFAGLWLLPALAAGAALWRVWRSRSKGEHSQLVHRDAVNAEHGRGNE